MYTKLVLSLQVLKCMFKEIYLKIFHFEQREAFKITNFSRSNECSTRVFFHLNDIFI